MNNNTSSDLNRFNDKYLKCIVTKRPSTMKVLKDHGAMIVYQNSGYNHLYLGDEFIASGYGFKSKKELNIATNIVNSYGGDQERINNSLEELYDALNNIKGEVREMLEDFKPIIYLKDEDGREALLNDVFFHGKTAEYKDFEITNITKTITYNNNKTLSLSKDQNTVNLPIGTVIRKVSYILHCEINDSGGIDNIYSSYYKSSDDYLNNAPTLHSVNRVQWQNLSSQKSLVITHEFTDPYIINSSQDLKIINNILINIAETTKEQYKKYPEILDSENSEFEFYSLENIIRKHQIEIDSLYVHPVMSFKYYLETSQTDSSLTTIKNNLENKNNTHPYKGEIVIENTENGVLNDLYINVTTTGINKITLFIPFSCSLHELSYVTETSEYNWTGAVGILRTTNGNATGNPIKLLYNNIETSNGEEALYVCYKIYQLIIGEGSISEIGKIHLTTINSNNDFSEDLYIGDYEEDRNITEPRTWELLNNENFNSMYWISYDNGSDYDINTSRFESAISKVRSKY